MEADQTSASASKPGPLDSAVNLDLSPPRPQTTSHVEEMEVDYMVLHFLHFSVLIIIMHRISFLVHPRSLRRLRIELKSTLTLIKGML